MEQTKETENDAKWAMIEYLSNRTGNMTALYFKGRGRVQLFVKDRIGPTYMFADDTLHNCLKLIVASFLVKAKKEQKLSAKHKKVYEALKQLKVFVDTSNF